MQLQQEDLGFKAQPIRFYDDDLIAMNLSLPETHANKPTRLVMVSTSPDTHVFKNEMEMNAAVTKPNKRLQMAYAKKNVDARQIA